MGAVTLRLTIDFSTFVAGLHEAGWALTKFSVRLHWPDRLPCT